MAIVLSSCAGAASLPEALGRDASSFRTGGIQAGPWWLALAERGGAADVMHIYIEGDGRAYTTLTTVSGNPTPKDPVALRLAQRDAPQASVVYLARPCQFVGLKGQPCTADTWTANRFSEEVMGAYTQAIGRLLNGTPLPEGRAAAKRAVLIGYSGGAVVALEVAKRLENVVGVVTVAGNLDPAATNTWHKVSPMPGAVRPYQYPGRLRALPVLHLVGAEDTTIRPELSRQVMDAAGDLACTKLEVVPGADHHTGWDYVWKTFVGRVNRWSVELPRCAA